MENDSTRKPLLLFIDRPLSDEELDIISHAIWAEPRGSEVRIRQLDMAFRT